MATWYQPIDTDIPTTTRIYFKVSFFPYLHKYFFISFVYIPLIDVFMNHLGLWKINPLPDDKF